MQALRRAVSSAMPGIRRASTTAGETTDKYWAPYFPKPVVTSDQAKKNVNKEMVGFMLLGERWGHAWQTPASGAIGVVASGRMRTLAEPQERWRGFRKMDAVMLGCQGLEPRSRPYWTPATVSYAQEAWSGTPPHSSGTSQRVKSAAAHRVAVANCSAMCGRNGIVTVQLRGDWH
jgi:hypothetical protein